MKARATLASVVALLALTAAVVSIAASPAFAAACGGTQGQALLLGCETNTATDITRLYDNTTFGTALAVDETGSNSVGVFAEGTGVGLEGAGDIGVKGWSTGAGRSTGSGVYGLANDAGSGVYGENDGLGYGVTGHATNTGGGTGVLGDAPNGVGVEADSANGTALDVNGKAVFSRSGVVTIAAGKSSLVVALAGVSTASMILATAQQNKAVYVKAAVPGSGSFTIRLTGNAPTGGLKVAYFVLN